MADLKRELDIESKYLLLKFLLKHKVIFHEAFLGEEGDDIRDDSLVDARQDAAVRGSQPKRHVPVAGVRRIRVHSALKCHNITVLG